MVRTAKIVGRILRRMLDRKIEVVFVEDQFRFRRGKETGDAGGMLCLTSRSFGRRRGNVLVS
jgi:hypothetical protein